MFGRVGVAEEWQLQLAGLPEARDPDAQEAEGAARPELSRQQPPARLQKLALRAGGHGECGLASEGGKVGQPELYRYCPALQALAFQMASYVAGQTRQLLLKLPGVTQVAGGTWSRR